MLARTLRAIACDRILFRYRGSFWVRCVLATHQKKRQRRNSPLTICVASCITQDEQAKLLMVIFRHKIVHLAQPKAVSEYNGKKVAWKYWHDNAERHLKLTKLIEPVQLELTSAWVVAADHEFEFGIANFVRDIASSLREPGGYLHTLSSDTDLQDRFEKAISEIYG